MALTLDEIIRKRLGTTEAAPVVPEATQQASQVLGAKTGRVAPAMGAGPAQTNIAEQQIAKLGEQQLQQIGQEGQLKAAQQEQQALEQRQGYDINKQEIDQRRQSVQQQARQQMGRLEQEHQQALGDFDLSRQKASVEQAGFLARLSNDKYITALQQAAEKKRLTNAAAIKEQLMKDAFANELAMLKDSTAFQRLIDSDQRTFETELAQMDINAALAILNSNLSAASQQQMAAGFGNIVTAGVGAWEKIEEKKAEDKYRKDMLAAQGKPTNG